jgi:hypothetical protein
MNRIIPLVLLMPVIAAADQYVSPHFRRDGTYIEGYHRSAPNGTTLDNYSHQGNTNPYTGERGYRTDGGLLYAPALSVPNPALDYRERGNNILGR